ncbi:sugar ABC transporter substrate-binding protein [Frankia gtarii]|uniref:sugar ABC transporter substrate-binding protein n=1 Tax=Frankia gtarii TaxID=2950102 RepID=UPI0021BEFFCD|nr:substrate-binding domain-containing protein [Frankia gtarii]
MAAAQATVNEYLKTPTAIGPTTPLARPPARGKTFVYLKCNLPQCATVGSAVQEAAGKVGWKAQIVNYDSANPATLISGLKQALRYDPVAVGISGIPEELWKSEEADYEKAGVAILPQQTGPVTISRTVPVQIGDDSAVAGKIVGSWFIADSKAKGKGLLVSVPAFPVLTELGDAIQRTVRAGCSACSFQTLNATVAQQAGNQIVPAVISALRRNPSLKYVVTTDGVLLTGLSAALRAAGLHDIRVGGALATAQNEQDILDGSATAFTSYNSSYIGWQLIDAALRRSQAMSFTADDGGSPEQLLVRSTVGTPSDTASAPADFREQFAKLWGLGA